MKALVEYRAFWVLTAIVVYPVMAAGLLLWVIMPPINMIMVPIWSLLFAGAVGGISDGLERTRRAPAQREARRYAPGVVPVQRTNAL